MTLLPNIGLIRATMTDYSGLLKLANYYNHALIPYDDGSPPKDETYFRSFVEAKEHITFIVTLDSKNAGFALLKKIRDSDTWMISEFFILEEYQGRNIGTFVVRELLKKIPGSWKLLVRTNNIKAIHFWRKSIASFTGIAPEEKLEKFGNPFKPTKRVAFYFDTDIYK